MALQHGPIARCPSCMTRKPDFNKQNRDYLGKLDPDAATNRCVLYSNFDVFGRRAIIHEDCSQRP